MSWNFHKQIMKDFEYMSNRINELAIENKRLRIYLETMLEYCKEGYDGDNMFETLIIEALKKENEKEE